MTEMSAEVARGEGNQPFDKQSKSSPPGSCVYVSPEPRTLEMERRPRVRRCVCVLLILVAALFIITLAVSLFALIALLHYQNALDFSLTTAPTATGTATDQS